MKKIQYLKTATVISFLIIAYTGGTLTLNIFFWLIVGIVASLIDLLCFDCDHLEPLKNLFILILVSISFYFLFNNNLSILFDDIILDKENKYTKERSEGQIFIINEIQKFIDNLKKL
jgi:hypothetical protein